MCRSMPTSTVGMLQRIQNATIISRTLAYHSSQPHQDTRAPSARAYLNDVRHHRNQSLWMAYRGEAFTTDAPHVDYL